VKLPVY
jgi:hypothetical protein